MMSNNLRHLALLQRTMDHLKAHAGGSLTVTGISILLYVSRSGGKCSMKQLVVHTGEAAATAYGAINRLQADYVKNGRAVKGVGLLVIKEDPTDQRMREVVLTPKGLEMTRTLNDLIETSINKLIAQA